MSLFEDLLIWNLLDIIIAQGKIFLASSHQLNCQISFQTNIYEMGVSNLMGKDVSVYKPDH